MKKTLRRAALGLLTFCMAIAFAGQTQAQIVGTLQELKENGAVIGIRLTVSGSLNTVALGAPQATENANGARILAGTVQDFTYISVVQKDRLTEPSRLINRWRLGIGDVTTTGPTDTTKKKLAINSSAPPTTVDGPRFYFSAARNGYFGASTIDVDAEYVSGSAINAKYDFLNGPFGYLGAPYEFNFAKWDINVGDSVTNSWTTNGVDGSITLIAGEPINLGNDAPVTVPAGLQPGDQYRVFFVTNSTTRPLESGVDYYNTHVSTDANAQPELAALGTTWKAVVSVRESLSGSARIEARDNTDTNPTPVGPTGVPIYLLNGTRLADNYDDLWDGSVQNPPNIARNGVARPGTDTRVWTGTLYDGRYMFAFGFGAWNWGEYDKTEHTIAANSAYGPTLRGGPFFVNATNNENLAVELPLYGISGILTVPSDNEAPAANAGADQSIHAGETVSLDGSASSDDNTPEAELDYLWEIVEAPENSTATLDVTNPIKPTFVADRDGDYVINLTVTDAGELSATDTVIISSFNQAPTAVATELVSGSTEHLMFLGDSVVLDGSDSSDSDGDEISYQWTITDAPLGSFPGFLDTDTAFPTLIPDVEGAYTVELVVSDFLGPGEPVTVDITVTLAIEYAENLIMEACDIVDSLSKDQVAKKGNRKKLKKELAKAIKEIQKGHICHAIKALNKVIRRVDGYPLRGELDCRGKSRDWVLDEDAQRDIYGLLTLAIETLE